MPQHLLVEGIVLATVVIHQPQQPLSHRCRKLSHALTVLFGARLNEYLEQTHLVFTRQSLTLVSYRPNNRLGHAGPPWSRCLEVPMTAVRSPRVSFDVR